MSFLRRCHPYFIVLSVSLELTGCSDPQVEHLSWDSLPLDELSTRLTKPTATLEPTISDAIVSEIEHVVPPLAEAARFVGHVAYVIAELGDRDLSDEEAELPDVSDPPPDTKDVWGTNLYLRLACPGDVLSPPFSFSNGELRIDSPELRALELVELVNGGEFLMSFNDCHVGDSNLDQAFPGRYVRDFSELALNVETDDLPDAALALDLETRDSPLGVVGFGCGSPTSTCQDDVRVAAEFRGSSGSYVIAFRVTQTHWTTRTAVELELRAANGTASCELEYQSESLTSAAVSCSDLLR